MTMVHLIIGTLFPGQMHPYLIVELIIFFVEGRRASVCSMREPGSKASKVDVAGVVCRAADQPDVSSAGPGRTPPPQEIAAGRSQSRSGLTDAANEHNLQRLQQRMESVQQFYKGRNPLVWF